MRMYKCDRCGKEIDPMGNYSVSVKTQRGLRISTFAPTA